MNKAEANKKAQEMIEARSKVICPLYLGPCEIKCECYKMPEVYEYPLLSRPGNTFDVRHGFCTCYALKGASD